MTVPDLERMKFWIVKPKASVNYILNPSFDLPEGISGYTATVPTYLYLETTERRVGASSCMVDCNHPYSNPIISNDVPITSGDSYTFSAYIKSPAGTTFHAQIINGSSVVKATKDYVATGQWQRVEVTHVGTEDASNYKCQLVKYSAIPDYQNFYTDGWQYEEATSATTFFNGDTKGFDGRAGDYSWNGLPRISPSSRSGETRSGGELVCINDYAKVTKVFGFGMGQFNQLTMPIVSGGDYYQGYIRKSRTIAFTLVYSGNNQGELQINRDIILSAVLPDFEGGQPIRILYQGFDSVGLEATELLEIDCLLIPSHTDTPDLPVYQQDTLVFNVYKGYFSGAYEIGELLPVNGNGTYGWYGSQMALIRDKYGAWGYRRDANYFSPLGVGLNQRVTDMILGPDGKIYYVGQFTTANGAGGSITAINLVRYNIAGNYCEPIITSSVGGYIYTVAFDSNGDLYVGGGFTSLNGVSCAGIAKLTDLNGTITVSAVGTGITAGSAYVYDLAVNKLTNEVYATGPFTEMGGVADTLYIAKWNGTSWSPLGTGLSGSGYPNGLAMDNTFSKLYATSAGLTKLACWENNSWTVIDTAGLSNPRVMVFDKNNILICSMYDKGLYSYNGSTFTKIHDGFVSKTIETMIPYGNNGWLIGGDFDTVNGKSIAYVALWENNRWQEINIRFEYDPGNLSKCNILLEVNGVLYVGGRFAPTKQEANVGTVLDMNMNTTSSYSLAIHGPGELHSIRLNTNKEIRFNDLTLLANETLTINFEPSAISFISDWRGDCLSYVAEGSYVGGYALQVGTNVPSVFMPAGFTTASNAELRYKPRYWNIEAAKMK